MRPRSPLTAASPSFINLARSPTFDGTSRFLSGTGDRQMKAALLMVFAAALAFGVSDWSHAQGRHDEGVSPHAQKEKKAQDAGKKAPKRSGGRHDEGIDPHTPRATQEAGKAKAPDAEGKTQK
jgi:hypothetical protein